MKNDSQFGPHRLLYRWMCEQFWKCGFSIEQRLLAIEKNCNSDDRHSEDDKYC